jgi:hypothetical protein
MPPRSAHRTLQPSAPPPDLPPDLDDIRRWQRRTKERPNRRIVDYTRPDGVGWSACHTKPYHELGTHKLWVSQPTGKRKIDRYPVDVFDSGSRRRNHAAAAAQAAELMARLTGSKTQKPVEVALKSPAQVPLPPASDELQHQLAYSDRRLRACRAGMDVVSHMAAVTNDDDSVSPRVRTPTSARELYRPHPPLAGAQPSCFSSRSLAATARTWGATTSNMRTTATIRRKSSKAPPQQSEEFLFPPKTSYYSPRGRTVARLGKQDLVVDHAATHTAMRDLAAMDEHHFLAPDKRLQENCTAFRAKQAEMEGRFQMALAQMEHHRSETYRSKLRASLQLKDTRLTAKQPLFHELKFMDLTARHDRAVRASALFVIVVVSNRLGGCGYLPPYRYCARRTPRGSELGGVAGPVVADYLESSPAAATRDTGSVPAGSSQAEDPRWHHPG